MTDNLGVISLGSFNETGFSPADFFLSANLLWIILAVMVLVFLFLSITLFYHWIRYSFSAFKATTVIAGYSVISVLIIIMAIVSLSYYQISI